MVDMTTASWEAWRSLQHAYRQSEAYRVQRSEFIASLQSTTVQLAAAKALLLAAQSDCVGRLLSKRSGSMDSRLVMAEAHFTALRTTTYQIGSGPRAHLRWSTNAKPKKNFWRKLTSLATRNAAFHL
ncbi:hypothetical protein ACKKBG_A22175 [Auxenochlorella protothecoides x Auxenochlorella symbiontica]